MRPRLRRVLLWFGTGLLVVVGFAAVLIPYYLNAVKRSIVRRTLGEIHVVASALEAYRAKYGVYPAHPGRQRAEVCSVVLVPEFLSRLPDRDVWAFPYYVVVTPDHYEVWSFGADGAPGPNLRDGPTDDWNSDILFSDGQLLRFPSGVGAKP
ncbi:MAG: hypothetical protein IPP07_29895 [Holophagales bacterium]|jgi:hypothetical protein|nr:hypothetical protein [Holophagales bacterium]